MAGLVFALVMLSACGPSSGILVKPNPAHTWSESAVRPVGATVTFGGGMMLINASTRAGTVTSVVMRQVDPGLRFDGWRLDTPANQGIRLDTIGTADGFPPAGLTVQNGLVPPSESRNIGGQLVGDRAVVVGLTLLAPGVHSAHDVVVTYRDTAGTHKLTFPVTLTLCGPATMLPAGYC